MRDLRFHNFRHRFWAVLCTAPFALILPEAPSVMACSCVLVRTISKSYDYADAVFIGECTLVEEPDLTSDGSWYRAMHLRVSRSWKGVTGTEVVVRTGLGGGDCGFDMSPGESYLVYAISFQPANDLHTGICSGTRVITTSPTLCWEFDRLEMLSGGSMPLLDGADQAFGPKCRLLSNSQTCELCGCSMVVPIAAGLAPLFAAHTTRRGRRRFKSGTEPASN